MSSSAYNRRRVFYIQTSDDSRREKQEVNQKDVYEQTVQRINQMLANAKLLLWKAKNVKDQIESSIQNETTESNLERFESFNAVQRDLMGNLVVNQTLDNSMTGAFVMRLCKQLSYWRSGMPFLVVIIPEIEVMFQEQKQTGILNIDEIYISTIKKVVKKSSELVRAVFNQVNRKIESRKMDLKKLEQVQPSVVKENKYQQGKNQKLKSQMIARMKRMIYRCYRDNDIVSIEVMAEWKFEITEDCNNEDFFNRQLLRNKAPKKQIKEFRHRYQKFSSRRSKILNSASSTLSLSSKAASLRNSHYKQNLNSPAISESSFKIQKSKLRFPVLMVSNVDNKKPKSISESSGKVKGLKSIKEKSRKKVTQIVRGESFGVKNIRLKL